MEKAQNGKDRLNVLMQTLLLRRTKADVGIDGKPIVNLPEKLAETHLIDLSEDEWRVYDKGLSTIFLLAARWSVLPHVNKASI